MAVDGAHFVPSSNRGLKGDQAQAALIDYITFSAPVNAVPAKPGTPFVQSVFDEFLSGTDLRLDRELRGKRNFYETHWRIVCPQQKVVGFIAV
ncbi:MAG: hypothetical protein ABJB01_02315, partial [Rudaea sp.]